MTPHRAPALASALALALAASGCLAAVDEPAPAAAAPLPAPVEGRAWLPPSQGQDRMETLVAVPDVPAGATMNARVVLGSTYVAPVPLQTADVLVELRDAAGEVIAEARLGSDAPEAELEGVVTLAGEAALALLSYGGSDGSSMGDHVDYEVAFS